MSERTVPDDAAATVPAAAGGVDQAVRPDGDGGAGPAAGPDRSRRARWIATIAVGALALAFLVPFYFLVLSALRPADRIFADAGQLIPTSRLTFENFGALFRETPFIRWFVNSMIIAGGSVIGSVTVVTMAAYPLARLRFRGRNAIFVGILATQMLPFQLLLIPLFLLMINANLIDSYLGVILPLVAHPFGLFYMRQYMLGLPQDLFDAARVDGASEYAIFFRVVVPMVKPALGTLAVLFSLEQWNELLWPLIVMRSEGRYPLAVGIASLIGQYEARWDLVMTAALLSVLPVMFLFFRMRNVFISGLGQMGTGGK
ncbi:MAG TPA: carbohydrate ABC transporter permease [Euzebyales bacterium]|nr:carbohydrate ABC transporter permease [Euzebyales bacterium]